jgi:hypothetical protein
MITKEKIPLRTIFFRDHEIGIAIGDSMRLCLQRQ